MLNLRALVDRLVEDVLSAIRNATLEELVETRGEPLPVRSEPRGRRSRGGRSRADVAPSAPSLTTSREPSGERIEKKARPARARGRRSAVERIEAAVVEAPAVGDITDPAALLASVARERHAEAEGARAGRQRAMPALLEEAPVSTTRESAPKTEPANGVASGAEAQAPSQAEMMRDRDPIRRGVVIRRARPTV